MRRSYFLAAMAVLLAVAVGCRSTATPTSSVPTAEPTAISTQPAGTPTPSEAACYVIPPVSDQDWTHGPADAPVTLIEYADFQ